MPQQEKLSFNVHLDEPYEEAVATVKSALKDEGFGVLSEIDVRKAFQEKLDKEFRPYVILGACNPPLAYRALSHSGEVGLMLPCNVTVEADEAGGSVVRIIEPQAMIRSVGMDEDPELAAVAQEAHDKLGKVARALGAE